MSRCSRHRPPTFFQTTTYFTTTVAGVPVFGSSRDAERGG
jgi:hypothetical protein